FPAFEIGEELWQRGFSLALKDVIGIRKFFDRAGDVRSAEHDHLPSLLAALNNLVQRFLLSQHSRDKNHVGPIDMRILEPLDLKIDQTSLAVTRQQAGNS